MSLCQKKKKKIRQRGRRTMKVRGHVAPGKTERVLHQRSSMRVRVHVHKVALIHITESLSYLNILLLYLDRIDFLRIWRDSRIRKCSPNRYSMFITR